MMFELDEDGEITKGQISAFRAIPLPQHCCPNIINMKAARRAEFEEV
jgi:hypothetical protein